MSSKKKDPTEISVTTAAALLKYKSPRQVQRLVEAGYITKPYTVVGVIHGYIDARDAADAAASAKANKNRVGDIRELKEQFQLEILRKEWIQVQTALAIIDEVFGPLRADIEALPAAASRDMAVRTKLEDLVAGILERATERAEKAEATVSSDGDDLEADEADMAGRLGTEKQKVPGRVGRPRSKGS